MVERSVTPLLQTQTNKNNNKLNHLGKYDLAGESGFAFSPVRADRIYIFDTNSHYKLTPYKPVQVLQGLVKTMEWAAQPSGQRTGDVLEGKSSLVAISGRAQQAMLNINDKSRQTASTDA